MLAKLRKRLTFANVVSLIALFVALGGSSYAAISITGKNVKNSSLTGKDIKNSSLTGSDVKNSSLSTSDIKNHSLRSTDFKAGQIPAGPRGADGKNGTNGFGLLSYPFFTFDVPNGGTDTDGVACDSGTFPTGGDAYATDADPDPPNDPIPGVIVTDGFAFDDAGNPVGWLATWNNTTGNPVTVVVEAACANASVVQSKTKAQRLQSARIR